MLPASFTHQLLHNRLGQAVELAVYHRFGFGREYVFVAALTQQLSSIVAKNAEHFAFQLREFFKLDARRFELIEMRGDDGNPEFWRWRFEWVGNSPLSPKCERVSSGNQLAQLSSLVQATPRAAIA